LKKQQGRNKALVFTILVIAAVLLGFIFHLVISGGKSADQDTPDAGIHESTDLADTGKKSVRAALKTFDVYRLDDLDFAFVIAILDIESPEHQTVTLIISVRTRAFFLMPSSPGKRNWRSIRIISADAM
jgi:hypothetical protein